ncbi:quinol:cytochrome C oxidoreductase [Tuwongella immobilis]|uniref:Quinol:cytochrome C oxidoreductase n=1 Tax=Tuwongella immobilis TaxID=692036 RepID=A0A6C2YNT7_9BACT|nr:quinol:cytochrome C oxidoreductase [Tuwongella immobilis]VIP02793.1 Uncharacterized protein OS=Isosphaera pallida (strain ATCC 43644 / DSM 9630 / IS1B) GN=Isop_0779 PE=4 SV=1 [Tuwongella immobilis]VTS02467.1 Uncharacterized protein OS=Isosphaera pallida (strain ATCC 43644 / DSM 9630 / IS1B) GN=Isop_0779 PE=4 SV=1 [Tuwongella immobilis]
MSSATVTIPEGLPDEVRLNPAKSLKALQGLIGFTLAAGVALAIGYTVDATPSKSQFWFSYLVGFTLALDVALGALFWNQMHHVTDAGWSVGIRRTYENMTRTIPVLAILFLPLAYNVVIAGNDAPWRWVPNDEINQADHLWKHKSGYLNPGFFVFRFAAYFAVWIGLSVLQRKLSTTQDATGAVKLSRTMRGWAFTGTLLLGVTATFAAFDLIMSLNFHWFSTIFGVYFWAGGMRGSLATLVLIMLTLRACGYLRHTVTMEHLHDCGKLLFGLTVFWTYIAFSQYFLIWYGNIPEETVWYLRRREGLWFTLSVLLPICYFVIPFFVLLPQKHKRTPQILGFAAAWILFFHLYDLYWQIMPEKLADPTRYGTAVLGDKVVEGLGRELERGPDVGVHWLDITSVLFFFGTLLSCTLYGMRQTPLIPIRDPRLPESLHFENELT